LPTPEIAGIAGAPGALVTCPAKTAADWCAKIATAAFPPAPPVYSHTMPPPRVAVWTGPLKEPPRADSAWLTGGQMAVPVVAATVVVVVGADVAVDDGVVVDEGVELVVGLELPDPQPARSSPTAKAPAANAVRFFMSVTIGPGCASGNR